MAQRTGAYGFVALLAIALVVSGCGGSSDTQATSAAHPAATTANSGSSQGASETRPEKRQVGKQGQRVVIPEGAPEPEPTPKQEEESPFVNMAVSSAAVDAAGTLSRTYTCDGKGLSPPIEWQGIPAGTKELAVFVMNFAPVEGELFFDWAVAGIDPETSGLEAGKTPPGAVVGRNSEGEQDYSLCPSGSGGESYVISVYALDKEANPKPGFDPAALRERAQEASESAGLLSFTY